MINEKYKNLNISIEIMFNSGIICEKRLIISDDAYILLNKRQLFASTCDIHIAAKKHIDYLYTDPTFTPKIKG